MSYNPASASTAAEARRTATHPSVEDRGHASAERVSCTPPRLNNANEGMELDAPVTKI